LTTDLVNDENVLIGKGEHSKNQNQPNCLESGRPLEELKAIESVAWPQCRAEADKAKGRRPPVKLRKACSKG